MYRLMVKSLLSNELKIKRPKPTLGTIPTCLKAMRKKYSPGFVPIFDPDTRQ